MCCALLPLFTAATLPAVETSPTSVAKGSSVYDLGKVPSVTRLGTLRNPSAYWSLRVIDVMCGAPRGVPLGCWPRR